MDLIDWAYAAEGALGVCPLSVTVKLCQHIYKAYQLADNCIAAWSSGDYVLVKGANLGEGSFGQVAVCKHRRTEEECTVKMVHKERRSTLVEIDMLKRTDNANIVKLRGIYQQGTLMYIVMEKHVTDLDNAIQDPDGKPMNVAHIARQIVASVHYLHHKKLMHRDVKCDNFLMDRSDLLDKQCKVVLADFGTACEAEPTDRFTEQVGTKTYWSPQVYDANYGTAADIFALGVVMFTLLKGRYPFNTENKTRVMKVFIPKVHGAACVDFTHKLLQKIEEDRVTAAEAMAHEYIA
ncbi:CPK4 [Symbiodinium natans]|uniref:CPK4 protein n=1 Tax=Symbiodinium natans TaxID=878477 RepID=A0A812MZ79_9DINO|nr:CPK4 [Symbiodinium natans]